MALGIFKMRFNVLSKIILFLFLNSFFCFKVLLLVEFPLRLVVGKKLGGGLLLLLKIV